MLFNSLDFAIFLPIVFLLYWFVVQKNLKLQNALIVVASYVFYGWWDWRFLSLILSSTIVNYTIGQKLGTEKKEFKRKVLLWTSIIVNLGFLGFFKYYNFFLENFVSAFSLFGIEIKANTLNIILPIGISFYTFQTLSYIIDVYRKKLEPTKDFIAFSVFVCFFPQLVAGPIERAQKLLPQILTKRKFSYSESRAGLFLIVYGFFKKLVIADNLATIVDPFFINIAGNAVNFNYTVMVVFGYAIQIYCDFSGYSDIAIGVAKQFGIKLSTNFKQPYFSRNILDFWKRWHISLTSWLTDYVFTPLAINLRHLENRGLLISVLFTFLLSGLWHGAGWNFVIYGLLHGVYYLLTILLIGNKSRKRNMTEKGFFYWVKDILSILLTFTFVSLLFVPFRSANISESLTIYQGLIDLNLISIPIGLFQQVKFIFLLLVFFIYEVSLETQKSYNYTNYFNMIFIVILILLFGNFSNNAFIYFQF